MQPPGTAISVVCHNSCEFVQHSAFISLYRIDKNYLLKLY